MGGMDEEREKIRLSTAVARVWLILVPLVAVPLVYVLSMGPALMLNNRGVISDETISWTYAPIDWLSDHFGLFGRLLQWYLSFWIT